MNRTVVTEQDASALGKDYKSLPLFGSLYAGFSFAKNPWGWLIIALLLALILKSCLLAANAVPFNSDEAVIALMARHILQGDRPIFFYGQAYMGSLDAWLVAAAFKVFGESVLSVRLAQVYLYIAYLLSLWVLSTSLFTDHLAKVLAVLLAAVPAVVMTTFTTASLGGYGETLVFGNLILWLGYQIAYKRWQSSYLAWLAFGLVAGLAFWTLALSLVYLLPVALLILVQAWKGAIRKKDLLMGGFMSLVGFMFGSLPWWTANLTGTWEPLHTLLKPAMVETTLMDRFIALTVVGLPTLIGARFPWAGSLSPLPVTLLSVLFYVMIFRLLLYAYRKRQLPLAPGAGSLMGVFFACFSLVFLLSPNGIDATGRYLLPVSMLLILVVALGITVAWRREAMFGIALLILVLGLNSIETIRAASSPSGILTRFDTVTYFTDQSDRELMSFLRQNDERTGYTNYWVSFRLAFLSGEELIYAARLPYKQDFSYLPVDDRIPAYSQQADESSHVAYITHLQPAEDKILEREFQSLGVRFKVEQVGPYHVFYALSRPVRPEELLWVR